MDSNIEPPRPDGSRPPPTRYTDLSAESSFRVAELLPGRGDDPVECLLHEVAWDHVIDYEALSYAWGDTNNKVPVKIGDKIIQVTVNLKTALTHLRHEDRSRFIWADALCINQRNITERGSQVRQMRRIFQGAQAVMIWMGPDNDKHQASMAFDAVHLITTCLCQRLGISYDDLTSEDEIYQNVIFKNRGRFPMPHEIDFVSDEMWAALLWLYKHPFFTRVWVIQEINANKDRMAYCGHRKIRWDAVELVAGYVILETAFSKSHGFTDSYCWWASTAPAGLTRADNWLHMLYLASNFSATDPRDVVYGLRGMIDCRTGGELLDPDYTKTVIDVYRDAVEASFLDYGKTNVLLYVSGAEDPSWVPRWDIAMLFRNPFRFAKPVPWRPAGDAPVDWSIDHAANVLSLGGFCLDTVARSEHYDETYFGAAMISTPTGRSELQAHWSRILAAMAGPGPTPLSRGVLVAAADAFSFGLDEAVEPAPKTTLLRNFVQYLRAVLDPAVFDAHVPPETRDECAADGDGGAFGKPVWDFKYPVSSCFVTDGGMIGCCISRVEEGDVVFVPRGSVYPLVLRPEGEEKAGRYRIRGFCFVHGVMDGEEQGRNREVVEIV